MARICKDHVSNVSDSLKLGAYLLVTVLTYEVMDDQCVKFVFEIILIFAILVVTADFQQCFWFCAFNVTWQSTTLPENEQQLNQVEVFQVRTALSFRKGIPTKNLTWRWKIPCVKIENTSSKSGFSG